LERREALPLRDLDLLPRDLLPRELRLPDRERPETEKVVKILFSIEISSSYVTRIVSDVIHLHCDFWNATEICCRTLSDLLWWEILCEY
jgi:hypothetical protein